MRNARDVYKRLLDVETRMHERDAKVSQFLTHSQISVTSLQSQIRELQLEIEKLKVPSNND